MDKRHGYTLLELLVVISIIAIIATAGFVSFAVANKKSRDTRRKEDLNAIADSLEQYFALCGSQYPTPDVGNKVPTSIVCNTQTIMTTVPTDPSTKTRYTMTGTSTSYSICAPNPTPMEAEITYPYCRPNLQ